MKKFLEKLAKLINDIIPLTNTIWSGIKKIIELFKEFGKPHNKGI